MNAAVNAWAALVCAVAGIAWDSLGLIATALMCGCLTVAGVVEAIRS